MGDPRMMGPGGPMGPGPNMNMGPGSHPGMYGGPGGNDMMGPNGPMSSPVNNSMNSPMGKIFLKSIFSIIRYFLTGFIYNLNVISLFCELHVANFRFNYLLDIVEYIKISKYFRSWRTQWNHCTRHGQPGTNGHLRTQEFANGQRPNGYTSRKPTSL